MSYTYIFCFIKGLKIVKETAQRQELRIMLHVYVRSLKSVPTSDRVYRITFRFGNWKKKRGGGNHDDRLLASTVQSTPLDQFKDESLYACWALGRAS